MTTQSHINPFTAAAADAHANWKAAQAELKAAHEAFNTGAVIRLKEILSNQGSLHTKLKASQLECTQAEAEFKTAFEAAGFEKNAAVQKILNKKNDALAICEELQNAIGQMQEEHKSIYVQANQEAKRYSDEYQSAFNAFCLMSAMAQLEKHGPPLVDALALVMLVPNRTSGLESDIGPNLGYSRSMDQQVFDARMGRLIGKLQSEAWTASAKTQDITDAIGVLDLGPLTGHKFLTPVDLHVLQTRASKTAA